MLVRDQIGRKDRPKKYRHCRSFKGRSVETVPETDCFGRNDRFEARSVITIIKTYLDTKESVVTILIEGSDWHKTTVRDIQVECKGVGIHDTGEGSDR